MTESDNIFEALGYENPTEHRLKADIVRKIAELMEQRSLTQAQAATLMEMDQPKVSALLRGKFSGFTIDRLVKCLRAFNIETSLVFEEIPVISQAS